MSTEKLFICEKPSQARDIARILKATQKQDGFIKGQGVIVTWCLGHLVQTAMPEVYNQNIKPWRFNKLPVIPDKWQMLPVAKVKKQLAIVKKLINNTQYIVIATDADREGELIAREIIDLCHYSGNIDRLWLNALDDISIQKALKNIKKGKETEALYQAGLGRQRADWLIGMNMTMATSSLFGKYGQGVLSVGRVQTPTLKLVVDRDLSIEDFKPQNYYELFAQFIDNEKNGVWLKWNTPKSILDPDVNKCLDKKAVEKVVVKIHNQLAKITLLKKSEKKTVPPVLFTLSTLQKKTSAMYSFSANKTLSLAQALYEKHKAISYPRTDSGYLPVSQFKESNQVLSAVLTADPNLKNIIDRCNHKYKAPCWNDKKVTAHHGIIPTMNQKVRLSAMSADEFKVYDLVRRLYIAQFLGDYKYMQSKITVNCKKELFSATGNIPLSPGWKQALLNSKWDDASKDDDETVQEIPNWDKGLQLIESKEKIAEKKTKPPPHYSEGTLIGAMESIGKYVEDKSLKKILKETSGIGTQATRAAIIETLLKREYIKRDKKKVISTDKGRSLLELIPDIVKDPATTALWEQDLEEVAAGGKSLDEFINKQTENLSSMLLSLGKMSPQSTELLVDSEKSTIKVDCPKCGAKMQRKKTKAHNRFFWGCSAYPDCTQTLSDFNGKPGRVKAAAKKTNIQCESCKQGVLVEREGRYGKFWGCSTYPKCKNLVKKAPVIKESDVHAIL